MLRRSWCLFVVTLVLSAGGPAIGHAAEIEGVYLEARTCQVYTGPCFAAGEVGLAGKEAVLAWKIESGEFAGVDLTGLSIVVVLQSDSTLGFAGAEEQTNLKSLTLIDKQASSKQAAALIAFVKAHNTTIGKSIDATRTLPIAFELDPDTLRAKLKAGKRVVLETRKANPDDCICSNESAYYPPLAAVEHFVPGVALDFSARGLKRSWTTSDTRSAYMGTFRFGHEPARIAGS